MPDRLLAMNTMGYGWENDRPLCQRLDVVKNMTLDNAGVGKEKRR
jgi:hypothetical protein